MGTSLDVIVNHGNKMGYLNNQVNDLIYVC